MDRPGESYKIETRLDQPSVIVPRSEAAALEPSGDPADEIPWVHWRARRLAARNRDRKYRTILVAILAPIGDTIFASATIHALRQRYPGAYIAALAYATNRGVLEGNPDIDEVIVYPKGKLGKLKHWRQFWQVQKTIRERQFDLAVELCAGMYPVTRLAGGIRDRVKMERPPFWWLVPGVGAHWGRSHAVELYLETLRPLRIRAEAPRIVMPVQPQDWAAADRFLAETGVRADELLITIHPGADGFFGGKRWDPARFAQVADALHQRHGARVVVLGGKDDAPIVEQILAYAKTPISSALGKTSLRESAALIGRSAVFIGNDSAPLHMAAALATPAVAIFGPSNLDNFRPWAPAERVRIVQHALPPNPCFNIAGSNPAWDLIRRPCAEHCECLYGVTANQILAAVESLLPVRIAERRRLPLAAR